MFKYEEIEEAHMEILISSPQLDSIDDTFLYNMQNKELLCLLVTFSRLNCWTDLDENCHRDRSKSKDGYRPLSRDDLKLLVAIIEVNMDEVADNYESIQTVCISNANQLQIVSWMQVTRTLYSCGAAEMQLYCSLSNLIQDGTTSLQLASCAVIRTADGNLPYSRFAVSMQYNSTSYWQFKCRSSV